MASIKNYGADSNAPKDPGKIGEPDEVDELNTTDDEQCLLYLFGELDADQTQSFVARLESSPALSRRLGGHAKMIASLGEPSSDIVFTSRESGTALVSHSSKHLMALIAMATAACITWAVFYNQAAVDSEANPAASDEAMLVALTWASDVTQLGEDESLTVEVNDADGLVAEDSSDSAESIPAWMLVALQIDNSDGTDSRSNDQDVEINNLKSTAKDSIDG